MQQISDIKIYRAGNLWFWKMIAADGSKAMGEARNAPEAFAIVSMWCETRGYNLGG